ncbi:MAG: ATP-binding cassette domain-containing protein [Defluviitaleaceae bacterium]|nr:ATP-binding cassette domain-containing protein [Defluviitaleaceae bacterium]
MAESVLKISNLNKAFEDKKILDNLSLEVEKGSITSIMGYSGSGKTTLLKILTGLIEEFDGSVQIFGKDVKEGREEIYTKTGVSMDELGIYTNFTALDNLTFFAKIFNANRETATKWLKTFGLEKDKNKKVKKFSKGMKQRLSLAMAMLKDPDLLILDEPHTGLDEDNRTLVNNLILDFKKANKTVLIVTHSAEDAATVSDQIYSLKNGKLAKHEEGA